MIRLGLFLLRLSRRLFGLRQEEVVLDGTRIVYSDGGAGEPLLLLHGLGASRSTFDMVAAQLVGRYRVLVPDLPGFGESGLAADGDYGIDAQVAWVERFVEHVGLGKFHLGGNSMGGWIAAAYAAKHPDKVQSLWLLAAAGTGEMLETEAVKARQERGAYLLLSRTIAEFDAMLERVFYRAPPLPLALRWAGARLSASKFDLHSKIFDQLLDRGEDYRLEPHLPRIMAPTLLVWGEHDTIVPLSVMERFAALVPKAEPLLMPEVGHVPQMEAPKQVAADYLLFRDNLIRHGRA
jgi:triacylglycerol lipase